MAYNFPANPSLNQVYSYNGKTFKWNGVQWVVTSAPTSTTAPVFVSTSPPSNPSVGFLWFNTTDNVLYVRVQSPAGEYWESTNSTSPPAPASGQVIVSASPPVTTVVGILWFNTIDSNLYVRVESLQGQYWELANNQTQADLPPVTISSSPPSNPSSGDLWFDPDNSNFSIWYNDIDGGQWVIIPYADNVITVDGGTFVAPIYAGYVIPDDPNAFVIASWVDDRVENLSLLKSLLTQKGSLITSLSAGTPVELKVGENGQFLKVDDYADEGIVWSDEVDCGGF